MVDLISCVTERVYPIVIFTIVECHILDSGNVIGKCPDVKVPAIITGSMTVYTLHTFVGSDSGIRTWALLCTCSPRALPCHSHQDSRADAAESRQWAEFCLLLTHACSIITTHIDNHGYINYYSHILHYVLLHCIADLAMELLA